MKKAYTDESIDRALHHHLERGVITELITGWTRGSMRWQVWLYGRDEVFAVSGRQAYMLCVALAASEHHAVAERHGALGTVKGASR